MVDTWATVGSSRRVGQETFHLSGGVGIGGVLEPCRPGQRHRRQLLYRARSEVVEGCIVREGSVLGMGVYIRAVGPKFWNGENRRSLLWRSPAGSGQFVAGPCPSKNRSCTLLRRSFVKRVDEKHARKLDQRAWFWRLKGTFSQICGSLSETRIVWRIEMTGLGWLCSN